ncbi:helix-turn-helix domain-containing protein [Candidatus Omnitrophota bacterium]
MNIGNRIKTLRKSKKITLKELSESSDVALATLSRIENSKMTGTIQSHQAIAKAMNIGLMELYGNLEIDKNPVDLQTTKNRTDRYLHNDKASYFMLTNKVLSKKMMPVILKVEPGGRSTDEELPRGTEKFLYVLQGECIAQIGTSTHTLKKDETLYFDGSIRHHFKNPGQRELQAICIITPPAL